MVLILLAVDSKQKMRRNPGQSALWNATDPQPLNHQAQTSQPLRAAPKPLQASFLARASIS